MNFAFHLMVISSILTFVNCDPPFSYGVSIIKTTLTTIQTAIKDKKKGHDQGLIVENNSKGFANILCSSVFGIIGGRTIGLAAGKSLGWTFTRKPNMQYTCRIA